MRLTKQQAVGQLIDGAIRAYEAGEHACAIVLAGSAEGAMPNPTSQVIFTALRDGFAGLPDARGKPMSEQDAVTALNAEWNWLKHYNPHQPNEMEITDSLLLVWRAISKFHALYGYEAGTKTIRGFLSRAKMFDPEEGFWPSS